MARYKNSCICNQIYMEWYVQEGCIGMVVPVRELAYAVQFLPARASWGVTVVVCVFLCRVFCVRCRNEQCSGSVSSVRFVNVNVSKLQVVS